MDQKEADNSEDQLDEEFDAAKQVADIPDSLQTLRACIPCMLVKTYEQFYNDGCENCSFLDLQDNKDKIKAATTAAFDGFIALADPANSWLARWCRIDNLYPGCYASRVHEDVSPEIDDLILELNLRNIGKLSQQDF